MLCLRSGQDQEHSNKHTHMLQEMGNVYKTNHHQPNTQATVFLPMLCSRSSFKDVRWVETGSGPSCDDDVDEPVSPKVGCMGQVKRNNRVVGFPTPNGRLSIAARAGSGKYSKIKRMFSARGLASNAVTKPVTPALISCRAAGRSKVAMASRKISCEKEKTGSVSIVDMDPPLPVTRKVRKEGDAGDSDKDQDNLWKRRSRGIMDLKKLELQKTRHQCQPHLQLLTV